MSERWARTMVGRPWWAIGLAAALLAFGGVRGTRVFGSLTPGGFDAPAFRRAVTETLQALSHDVVTRTVTYRSTGSPALVSHDRHAAFAVLPLARDDEAQRGDALDEIEDELTAPGLRTQVGGATTVDRDIRERVAADTAFAETISIPVLLVLLVVGFGSLGGIT
ncbi:MMPL family transporter [Streptomyces sp. NPDC091217]|uniref:MMPL family transporter n=1 Tax=Streptomyces sp. NPDC091217 TaxID=3365975 RepID=UPI003830E58C